MKRQMLALSIFSVLFSGSIMAAGGPPTGGGGGGGGGRPGGGEETAGNNLSVPAIFVAGSGVAQPALRVPCSAVATRPGADGAAPTYIFEDEYYWTQKSAAVWSASCLNRNPGELVVTADWGDNLTGDGRLSSGRPIRVEVGLINANDGSLPTGTGYAVVKLTPDLEDRLSTYGTKGDETLTSYRAFDAGAMLKIEKCSTVECLSMVQTIYEGPMTAEINSIGAVVFGFNWGIKGPTNAPGPGTYRIAFFARDVNIVGVADAKASVDTASNSTYLYVTIGSKGGGSSRQ
jgi:hypothetical protein